tara:strand:+ start:10888 stop:11895 length:1008 start_codon:yes stop_codon:yes gene_type:complete
MNESYLISLILPVYNGEKYLEQAIKSCLSQTYKNFELIIVDDASTDQSLKIAEDFLVIDNRVSIISNTENKRLPESLNIGHKAAKGTYLTWTSHDNILKHNFLEILIQNIQKTNVDIVFSNYDIITFDGILKREHVTGPIENILFGNFVGASFLYKKEVFEKLKGYSTDLFLVEDYDFWIRSSQNFSFYHIQENLYSYRIQEESLTSQIFFDSNQKLNHRNAINKMFNKLALHCNWNLATLNLILNIHNKNIRLTDYLKNKKRIEADFVKFAGNRLVYKQFKLGLIENLRIAWKSNKLEQNIIILFQVACIEKEILFHQSFSKKETLKLILKNLY